MKSPGTVNDSIIASVHSLFRRSIARLRGSGGDAVGRGEAEVSCKKVVRKPVLKDNSPKIKNLNCPMCMGYIKIGLQYAKCDCGHTYHVVCLARTGFCPICNKRWDEESVRSVTHVNGDPSKVAHLQKLPCPSCDRPVSIYDLECQCGAVFVKDNDSFLCPECGGRVDLLDMTCHHCGEHFRECDMVTCPDCGHRFDASEGTCECGTFVGDRCPDCGSILDDGDRFCGNCGVEIDIVEMPRS
ncbi:MAG TPA: zinc ribbon domain-containing protein [Methanomassiliicoccales archaeon]|nr:zinc ribbon domain-containing protein [Methanomassiliicoccales archaeon]